MFQQRKVLAIIPARGGSKRLPGKNLAVLANKPLIGWTIEAAIGSALVDHIVLSTDSPDIAGIGLEFGVHEIINRTADLATDDTSINSVIRDVLVRLDTGLTYYDYILLLQPTSPLRTSMHIIEAFALIENTRSVGAISLSQTEHPVEWMGKVGANGVLDSFFKETQLEKQSQEFSPSYQVNGAIYIVPVKKFLQEETLFLSSGMIGYIMDPKDSIDIDNEYDLLLARYLLSKRG